MVRLKADPDAGGVSYGGQEYPLVRGCVEVPEEAALVLLGCGWGFTLAGGKPDTQPAPAASPGNGEPAAPKGKSKK
jgi:hypothetical protein